MKAKFIIITLVLIACGTSGLTGWSDRPSDEGAAARKYADKIMRRTYGENWFETFVASAKTNRSHQIAMTATYKSALGFQPAK